MKKNYILLFSLLYLTCIILGFFFQSIFYFFSVNGIFTILSIWGIYFLTNRKNETPIIENKNIKHVKEPKKEIKEQPSEYYVGEIISDEQFKDMEIERKTWFTTSNEKLINSLSELSKKLEKENYDKEK